MRAALARRYGAPRVVELADLPEPKAGPGQVVVEDSSHRLRAEHALVAARGFDGCHHLQYRHTQSGN